MTLEERAAEAQRRIAQGMCNMRIPADLTDPDLVISDLLAEVERLKAERDAARAEARLLRAQVGSLEVLNKSVVDELVDQGRAEERARFDSYKEQWRRHYESEAATLKARLELEQASWFSEHLNHERDDAVEAERERCAKLGEELRDKAVRYLDRCKPFSDDGMADSLHRADMQRELFIIAAAIRGTK